ncbi:MAG: peptide chain release factor 2 [Acidobacteriota bacterium]|nr:peptide chain release factor 2 [Acidobacteriota bacterium]
MIDDLVRRATDLLKRAADMRSYLDDAHDPGELAQLEQKVAAASFWDNQADAQKTLQRQRRLAEDLELGASLAAKIDDIGVLLEWARSGEDVLADLARALDALGEQVEAAETKKMLSGEHDLANAIITIHPGAGGVESQDWAEMLLRMYLKWAERRGFKREMLEYQPGEEAGLKSVTFTLTGEYAFGLMAAEAGVHRLVRISPFDQAARRHTSFASVYVWPEFDDEVAIDIPEKELRIDTYRSSGAGGQHVNVTDSAVRITHLPTGIVTSCQNERSQHKNKDVAMKVLKAKLYDLKQKEQQEKLSQIGGAKKDIAFGSQIRSYVLQPYQMIKDHRTKFAEGQVDKVLGGDIDAFIKTYLMQKATGTLGQAAGDDVDE